MDNLSIDNALPKFPDTDISHICKPLFSATPIKRFHYAKIYFDDASVFFSAHDSSMVKSKIESIHSEKQCYKDFLTFIPNTKSQKKYTQASETYNYFKINVAENSISLVLKNNLPFYEVFEFVSLSDEMILFDFYINNLDMLYHFSFYFKDQARDIIKLAEKKRKNKVGCKNTSQRRAHDADNPLGNTKKNFYKITKISSIPFVSHGQEYYLSNREVECLSYLILGYSAKQTAKTMCLSPKTVEFYINSAKQKLDCYTTSELIKKIFKLKLINYEYLANFID